MWKKYDLSLWGDGSLVSAAVSAIPYALAVLCDILIYWLPLCVIQQAPFAFGLGVRGHLHIANLLSALLAFPFSPRFGMTFARFSKGTRLRSLGKLCRGFVQMFLASPFHGLKLA